MNTIMLQSVGISAMLRLKDFLKQVFVDYASGITGGLTAPLVVVSFFLNGIPRWAITTTLILCVFNTAYQVWSRERSHVERLREDIRILNEKLNEAADFQGTMWIFPSVHLPSVDLPGTGSILTYQSKCVNKGQKPAVITRLGFTIAHPEYPVQRPFYVELSPDRIRSFGHGEVAPYAGHAYIGGILRGHLAQSTVSAFLIDSFGKEYHNIETKWSDCSLQVEQGL
jgi:hypothetical protein